MIQEVLKIDARKVEEIRKRKNMRQEDLAKKANLGLRTCGRIAKAAKPLKPGEKPVEGLDFRLSTVGHIAEALGVKPFTILADDPDPAE